MLPWFNNNSVRVVACFGAIFSCRSSINTAAWRTTHSRSITVEQPRCTARDCTAMRWKCSRVTAPPRCVASAVNRCYMEDHLAWNWLSVFWLLQQETIRLSNDLYHAFELVFSASVNVYYSGAGTLLLDICIELLLPHGKLWLMYRYFYFLCIWMKNFVRINIAAELHLLSFSRSFEQRWEEDDCVKWILEANVGGQRIRGRQRKRWIDVVKYNMEDLQLNVEAAEHRAEWRRRTHVADPLPEGSTAWRRERES